MQIYVFFLISQLYHFEAQQQTGVERHQVCHSARQSGVHIVQDNVEQGWYGPGDEHHWVRHII